MIQGLEKMHILFTDETNMSPENDSRVKFFAYGGLIVPLDNFLELDEQISKLRSDYGYTSSDSLKFDTNSKPSGVSAKNFAELKSKVVNLCLKNECRFLVYVVLHKIAASQGIDKTLKWGADHIMGKFNHFLKLNKSKGVVVIDRLQNVAEYKFLSEKFTKGLLFNGKTVPLEHIRLFSSSCDNASNLSSAMDIILGSFRYCINQPLNEASAKIMMKDVVKLLWADRKDDQVDPYEKGLTFRPNPESIKVPQYKNEYTELIKHINSLLL